MLVSDVVYSLYTADEGFSGIHETIYDSLVRRHYAHGVYSTSVTQAGLNECAFFVKSNLVKDDLCRL